jgi:phosphoglycerate dehydrogenase-like enzyme
MCLGAMRLLAAFFERTGVLGLHLLGNREIRGIITANDLARMQPTAGAWLCRLTPGVREVLGNPR